MAADAYLALARSINSSAMSGTWTNELKDGRTIQVTHRPTPDGGWVATHEDITELKATRTVANERISLQTLIDWVPDYLWVKDSPRVALSLRTKPSRRIAVGRIHPT